MDWHLESTHSISLGHLQHHVVSRFNPKVAITQQSLNFEGLKKVVISKIAARKAELNVPAMYIYCRQIPNHWFILLKGNLKKAVFIYQRE
jgi:hypothetical protein